jgi:FkbM family methyltransferase
MKQYIYQLYALLFARRYFQRINFFFYELSLRGMGILNYEREFLTGEKAWLRNFFNESSSKKITIIDVGANIGRYSKYILDHMGYATIHAFEPHPLTYKKLCKNVTSDRFHAYNLGVGDRESTLKLYDYNLNDGSSHASLYKDVIECIHKSDVVSHEVQIISLDDFFKSNGMQIIDLLKIDTEGNEYKVLIGALEYIKKRAVKVIQFEFNEMNIISQSRFKDFWDILSDYKIYRILPGGGLYEIREYSPVRCEIFAFQNIVAILK